ncbi:MAG: glycosyl transferase [Cyanobacteria bacterium P01_A01_bin.114]
MSNVPTLYLAITNHGFGHATRAASIAATLQQQQPDLRLIVATIAPPWLLDSYLVPGYEYRAVQFDIGVLQRDSLTMDKAATLEKLQWIRANQDDILADEIEFLKQTQAGLVLADIPPLATVLAKAAGIPCWMVSNFGWDFIYRPWGGEFEAIADWIAECFGQCDRMFRLPFHEPMSAFPNITDVGLTGGTPHFSVDQLRDRYGFVAPIEKTVLLTFGGLGLAQIPYDAIAEFADWQFITFDRQAPDLPNLFKVNDRSLRPVDFMPICDRVVSKPGYSTFSEACRLDRGLVTLPREGFSEAALLLEGMQDYARHQILDADAFFSGDWSFLHQPLRPPRQGEPIDKRGNQVIAGAIADYLRL